MSQKDRVVFLKLSGERLGLGNPENLGISPAALKQAAKKIAKTYIDIKNNGMAGLVLVPGAGNMVRGDRFEKAGIAPDGAHRDGRLATLINADRMFSALQQLGAVAELLVAPTISYYDSHFKPKQYSADILKTAIEAQKIIIIGGGSGEDNATTDNAVAYYASDYSKKTQSEVLILKGTKYDGVFDADPAKNKDARKIKIIGAPNMLADYDRYSVVDRKSLERLIDGHLSMVVYKDETHEVMEILQSNPLEVGVNNIGTAIVPEEKDPIFY